MCWSQGTNGQEPNWYISTLNSVTSRWWFKVNQSGSVYTTVITNTTIQGSFFPQRAGCHTFASLPLSTHNWNKNPERRIFGLGNIEDFHWWEDIWTLLSLAIFFLNGFVSQLQALKGGAPNALTHIPPKSGQKCTLMTLIGIKPSALNYEQTIFKVRGAKQRADKNAALRTEILPILDIFCSV